jgi:hypothetical protein
MARVRAIPTLISVLFIAAAVGLSACSSGARTSSEDNATQLSASPVGHRWTVENEDGLICYDSDDDLETARSLDDDFENMTPDGFRYTGDQSAGGRLAQGDIISIDSAGQDYYIVTPVRATIASEGKQCAVDIATLRLSAHNIDAKQVPDWKVGAIYTGANEITPCFATHALATVQYDAEVNNVGTGNGDQSLSVNDGSDDPARYRLEKVDSKVLTFYVVRGDRDVTVNRYTVHAPHTGQTIYCAHESKPQPG